MTKIVLLGDKDNRFLTHRELDSAVKFIPQGVSVEWLPTDAENAIEKAQEANGLWVVPGTPYKNDDTVYAAIQSARTSHQPLLGTCGGFQYAVVEFARNAANIDGAAHAETNPEASHQIVEKLSCSLIGEERTVVPIADTRFSRICSMETFTGFHFCNFGLSDQYIEQLQKYGLRIGARAQDAGVEAIELPSHPFFMATLFQPQVGTEARGSLHPLIQEFVHSCEQR